MECWIASGKNWKNLPRRFGRLQIKTCSLPPISPAYSESRQASALRFHTHQIQRAGDRGGSESAEGIVHVGQIGERNFLHVRGGYGVDFVQGAVVGCDINQSSILGERRADGNGIVRERNAAAERSGVEIE